MKLQKILWLLLIFLFMHSCTSEDVVAETSLTDKEMSVEMESFKIAMISWMRAKHQVKNDKSGTSNPNDVILKEAKELIRSENQIERYDSKLSSVEKENAIISQAFRIYAEKTKLKD